MYQLIQPANLSYHSPNIYIYIFVQKSIFKLDTYAYMENCTQEETELLSSQLFVWSALRSLFQANKPLCSVLGVSTVKKTMKYCCFNLYIRCLYWYLQKKHCPWVRGVQRLNFSTKHPPVSQPVVTSSNMSVPTANREDWTLQWFYTAGKNEAVSHLPKYIFAALVVLFNWGCSFNAKMSFYYVYLKYRGFNLWWLGNWTFERCVFRFKFHKLDIFILSEPYKVFFSLVEKSLSVKPFDSIIVTATNTILHMPLCQPLTK